MNTEMKKQVEKWKKQNRTINYSFRQMQLIVNEDYQTMVSILRDPELKFSMEFKIKLWNATLNKN